MSTDVSTASTRGGDEEMTDDQLKEEIVRVALIWVDTKRPHDELQYRALLADVAMRLHRHRS
jgi:hypothetical protein